jgi:riboflavin kinase/FMN adenylyltransferase
VRIFRSLHDLPDAVRHGAISVGNFDGVHLGHAGIVARLIAKAKEAGGPAVVFTFDPHPVRVLRPSEAPPPLTWTDRKGELLAELGVDAVIAYPTDEAFLHLDAYEFFDEVVRRRLDARAIVEGKNFYFGRNRQGNTALLGELCQQAGIALEVVPPVEIEGQTVSSSRVRRLVAAGDVGEARRLLTRPYRLRGMVVHGAGRGAKLGFPTANLEAIDTVMPAEGIYACLAEGEGIAAPAAVSIGPNPTFGEGRLKVEAFLIGFSGTLYGRPLELDFLARLRGVERYPTVEALLAQMDRDVAQTRCLAAEYAQARHD